MANRLDQALDEVIQDRRRDKSNINRRNNDRSFRQNNGFSTRRDNGGGIRKRLGNAHQNSTTIRSFVRTVNVQNNERRGGRDVNSQWAHDMFDDDDFPMQRSVLSRLGNTKSISDRINRGAEIKIENLHYNVTEKDLQDLFATVGEVTKAKIIFDTSGRSTGVGFVKYNEKEDAEKAIEKYHKVEFDGQPMSIEITERRGRDAMRGGRRETGRTRGGRDSRDRGRDSRRSTRDNRGRKEPLSAEDLDKEMENYMNSNNNEDSEMLLD